MTIDRRKLDAILDQLDTELLSEKDLAQIANEYEDWAQTEREFYYPPMLKDYDFVTKRIATGGVCYGRNVMYGLDEAGFTVVVDCQREQDFTEVFDIEAPHIAYLKNGVPDDGKRKPVEWFQRTADWIGPKLDDPDNKFLIHCGAGINRGPSMCYFVLRMAGMTADEAYYAIRQNRRAIGRWGFGLAYVNDADHAIEVLGL